VSFGQVAVSSVIDARPEDVYDLLADYHQGHPTILPRKYFTDLAVEQGGRGSDTVIRVTMRAFGMKRTLRMTVAEPEPGRVLTETDVESSVITRFTVSPVDGGKTHLEIATDWRKPGIAGAIERKLNPRVARRIYRQELELIAGHFRQHDPVAAH
jgi:hypothetical protein